MLGLVLATLWRRRAQTALLLLLATVAATGAATAPGYVAASLQSLAAASVGDAPVSDRLVTATADADVSDRLAGDLAAFRDRVTTTLALPDFTTVTGAHMVAVVSSGLQQLVYRQDVCPRLAIEGACPANAREVLLPAALAQRLGVPIGAALPMRGRTEIPPVPMTVVGTYRALDPFDPYWGDQADAAPGERLAETAILTPLATFGSLRPNQVALTLDLVATPQAYRDADPEAVTRTVEHGALVLGAESIQVRSGLRRLTDRLGDERRLVVNGVVIGVGELLVVCWLALFLAVRRTAETRRGDIGLLKLRGTRRRDLWLLVAAQSLLPLVAGGTAGLLLGPPVAAALAGPASTRTVTLTLAAVAVAVLGAAVAALAAERQTLGESVATLGRRVGRPRLGRLAIIDAIVVLLALAGAYQTTTVDTGGVTLLAPLLLALAVGVLAARLVPLAANRFGGGAVRAGRLGTGLSAMHLARRTGTASVLGVVVVVVAVLTSTALSWSIATSAREQRAVAEIGAPRVVTVRAGGPHELLEAVRAADPEGRAAMAVVRTEASAGTVLAVDTGRLAAFTPRLDAYGLPEWAAVVAALHPGGYAPAVVRADPLSLDATWSDSPRSAGTTAAPVFLVVRLVGADGAPVQARAGPLLPGRHTYPASAPACANGCRLSGFTLTSSTVDGNDSTVDIPRAGAALTVHALAGLADAGLLGDRTRWRAGLGETAQVPDITAAAGGLRLGIGPGVPRTAGELAATAYVADAPSPLPVLRAGEVGLDRADPRSAVVGNDVLPVRVAASGLALPAVGTGLLADLEYADRLGTGPQEATLQVWLADTPAGAAALERLTGDGGVEVLADDSIAARRAALDARGPATALRFLFAVALVLVAMGLLTFAVAATAERRTRGAELAALRRQGLSARIVRRVALVGSPALALVAVAIGGLTGLGVHQLIPEQLPVFVDGTAAFPTAPGGSATLLLVLAAAAAAFLAVAAITGLGLVAAVRRGAEPS